MKFSAGSPCHRGPRGAGPGWPKPRPAASARGLGAESECGCVRRAGGRRAVGGPAAGSVCAAGARATLRPGAKLTQCLTMDSRPEEYELNGDLRPSSPGSPGASVSTPSIRAAVRPCPTPALSEPCSQDSQAPTGADPLRAASAVRVGVVAMPPASRPLASVVARSPGMIRGSSHSGRLGWGAGCWQAAVRGPGQVAPTRSCAAVGPGRHLHSAFRGPCLLGSHTALQLCLCSGSLRAGTRHRTDPGLWAPGQQRADSYVTYGVHSDRTVLCCPDGEPGAAVASSPLSTRGFLRFSRPCWPWSAVSMGAGPGSGPI